MQPTQEREPKPVKITVNSAREFLAVIRGAHHIKNAIEIYHEETETVFYICALDHFNKKERKKILAKASNLLQRNKPELFRKKLKERFDIRREVFREISL